LEIINYRRVKNLLVSHEATPMGGRTFFKVGGTSARLWGAVRKKILSDRLEQKLLSLRRFSYLCAES